MKLFNQLTRIPKINFYAAGELKVNKYFIMTLAIGMLASVTPAMATTFNIDFESFSGGDTIVAGTDVGGGLTFDRDVRIDATGLLSGPPATSGNVAFAPNATFAQGDDVIGFFATSVSNIRLGAGDLGFDQDTIILTAFDAAMNVVGTDSFAGSAAQFLEVTGAGITSFLLEFDDVRPPAGTGSGGFDNISFKVSAVPLPATLPALIVGVLGLGLVGRRRKRA